MSKRVDEAPTDDRTHSWNRSWRFIGLSSDGSIFVPARCSTSDFNRPWSSVSWPPQVVRHAPNPGRLIVQLIKAPRGPGAPGKTLPQNWRGAVEPRFLLDGGARGGDGLIVPGQGIAGSAALNRWPRVAKGPA